MQQHHGRVKIFHAFAVSALFLTVSVPACNASDSGSGLSESSSGNTTNSRPVTSSSTETGASGDADTVSSTGSGTSANDTDTTASGSSGGVPACDGGVAAGARSFGLDLLDTAATDDFDTNVALAHVLGVEFIALHVPWTMIEVAPGDLEDPEGALAALSSVASDNDWRFSLTLRPIDLTGKTVPADLEGTRFDAPQMTERFMAVLDLVLGIVPPAQVLSLQVGNEIDGFDASGEHPEFWSDYGTFLSNIVEQTHQRYPGVEVGFTGTLRGLTSGRLHDLGVWQAYAEITDNIGVTYYPQNDAFEVLSPDVALAAFDLVTSEYPGVPLRIQEIGYQTSSVSQSDEAMQAQFYCAAFKAWDQHADQIRSMEAVRLYDYSARVAALSAIPYGIDSETFEEYLRTLGLRTFGNLPKTGFDTIRQATTARGFGR